MTNHRTKLKTLLRELFQFDAADLDFGIYRIMNQRRTEIDDFIERGLLDAVVQEFTLLQEGVVEEKREELNGLARQVCETLGESALDADGNIVETYAQIPLALRYVQKQEEIKRAAVSAEAEAEIFNALYTFFSRYYDQGDFVTKRRYSRTHKYAIPYNGEEVLLHWANRDQYYVKTADVLTDYAFRVDSHGGYRVRFKLAAADTEQDNVKGDKRYFFPAAGGVPSEYDEDGHELTLFFEYRPLNDAEETTYGRARIQEKIIEATRGRLLDAVPDVTLRGLLATPPAGKEVPLLDLHLTRWTRKATSDYFIHKDLQGFLERELDFYLKNEVMRLDDLDTENAVRAEQYLTKLVVIKRLARKIIAFLAQIEDFDKALFEKPKFVLSSEWCVTLDRAPEDLWPQVAANDAQWAEWERLFGVQKPEGGEPERLAFLAEHPTLTVDTALYDVAFNDALLAALSERDGGLEAQRDGLLIHGENFQALTLLQPAYRGKVKCIYIDPPFNTGTNEFLYKNNYLDSSWLAMLHDRLKQGKNLLGTDGNIFVRIDHHGNHFIRMLLNSTFGENFRNEIVIKRGRETAGSRGKMEIASETIYWYSCSGQYKFNAVKTYRPVADIQWTGFTMGGERHPRERVFLGKELIPSDGQHWSLRQEKVDVLLADFFIRLRCRSCGAKHYAAKSTAELHRKMKQRKHRYKFYDIRPEDVSTVHGTERLDVCLTCGASDFRVDYLGSPEKSVSNLWLDIESYARTTDFFTENSEVLLRRVIETSSDKGGWVLDFFLGSGTTAAVAMKTGRKWIGVEMGKYFYTIILPRLKQTLYGKRVGISSDVDWKGGGIFNYLALESYEDTLDNLDLDTEPAPAGLFPPERDDYLLRYFLDHETRQSRLNVESFATPFDYQLRVRRNGVETRVDVDLVETANFLLGLAVHARRVYEHQGRTYRVVFGTTGDQSVVVIWRDTAGLDLEAEAAFIRQLRLPKSLQTSEVWEPDRVYVNGDSHVPNAQPIEAVFMNAMRGAATVRRGGN